MISIFAIIGRDGARRSTESRRSISRQLVLGSSKGMPIFFVIIRMVSTMAIKNSVIFAAHGAMKRPRAMLWQGMLFM
jgi:hypothetical protein